MAEIRSYLFVRHLRAETSAYVLRYRAGRLVTQGRALGFWFRPLTTSVAELPIDDQELHFLFHARSADFQDVAVQGAVAYRVREPERLAERIDFSIDLVRGRWLKKPLEAIGELVTPLAQQHTSAWVAARDLREVLAVGPTALRLEIEAGLLADAGLAGLGLEISAVRISSVAPEPEIARALEAPMRERFQQAADQASFERRALAVEKERAIQENELQNQIELAKREEALIRQRGVNEQQRLADEAQAARIESEGKAQVAQVEAQSEAERDALRARTRAEATALVERARVAAEAERMAIYRDMPQQVLLGLAAQELAQKLQKIEHVRIEPDSLKQLVQGLGKVLPAGAGA
jgi:SPFH domain / Band 7 family